MTTPKKILADSLAELADDASLRDVQMAIARAEKLMGEERLYHGWKRAFINLVACLAVPLVVASVYFVRDSRETGIWIYAFWAIAPPAWFFVEWVWLFRSRGDAHRLNQFKTTLELSQKFWGGVLILLGLELFLLYSFKP